MKTVSCKSFAGVLAVLLVVAMLLTMVGCGNKPEPDPSQDNDVSTGVSQDDNSQVEDDTTDTTDEGDDTTDESADTTDESADATDESTDATDESADVSDESVDGTTTTTTTKRGETTKTTVKTTTKKGETTKTTVKTTTKKGETTKTTAKTTTKKSETTKTTGKTSNTPAGPSKATTTTKATTTVSVTKTTMNDSDKNNVLTQVPSKLDGTKIKMLIWWSKGTEDTVKADNFKAATGINVTYETAELKKYQTRLSAMVMAQNSPNLAAIINEWYPQPITRKLMQPIKNTGWDYTEEIYATNMMDQFSYKGDYYGIALKGSTMSTFMVMFYNKNILTQKGVTKTPSQLWAEGNWNWDTCLEIAQKTTDNAKGETGMSLTYQNYWMLSAGQDFVLADKSGLKNNVRSKELLEAWYFAWDVIYQYKVVDTSFTAATPFFAGKSAMFAGGSFFMQAEASRSNYVPQNMPEGSWGVVPFPSPEGMNPVAACEGTVWGFAAGKKNSGDALQAAMWYLRYFLDDKQYASADYYPTNECWDVMDWMWKQNIQSFNSVGVLTYGGEHSAASIQYNLIDEASSGKDTLKSNLDSWYSVLETNISKIENELA